MKKTIYVPDNFAVPELIANIEGECNARGIGLVRAPESICMDHMLQNRADMALLSPYAYGQGVKRADFRIIPSMAASLVGYTGKGSLYFRGGIQNINTIGANNSRDFLIRTGNILIAERYEIEVEPEQTDLKLPDIIEKYDCAILYGQDAGYFSMDISEDWFESYEIPLPLGFWVVRNEETPEEFPEITNLFAMDGLPEEVETTLHDEEQANYGEREGRILTRWNSDVASALEQTLELLYYRRLLPEIPAVKILEHI